MTQTLAWLLGFKDILSIEHIDVTLAAPWAEGRAVIVLAACLGLGLLAAWFYQRREERRARVTRHILTVLRAALFILLMLTLAAPLINSSANVTHRPLVGIVVDDTSSMATADPLAASARKQLQTAVGLTESTAMESHSRTEYVRHLLNSSEGNLIHRLIQNTGCRVEPFVLSGTETSELRRSTVDGIAAALRHDGEVTDLAAALADLPRQIDGDRVNAVIIFSDFADTTGVPVDPQSISDVRVPVYTVGAGETELPDIQVAVRGETAVKLGQPTKVFVDITQGRLLGRTATVSLEAVATSADAQAGLPKTELLGEASVVLNAATQTLDFDFVPQFAGEVEIVAHAAPFADEIVPDNNVARHDVNVIADHLGLLYIADEPTWEWRFIKEVFQRDKLVGERGFRTFLASSDPAVRRQNPLFLQSAEPAREEFFANDVLFLGDSPSETLTTTLCDRIDEFVGTFGGGLVVVMGPRFGTQAIARTPLAKMLPVMIDGNESLRDQEAFQLQRTAEAALFSFMTLADTSGENERAWSHLGELPWYQPVDAVHEQATVLAAHPIDLCADGRTHQPLIAVRSYGHGQVVYLAMNEMWRLRRESGDRYYQRFWSQLIYRLGMSHPVGTAKRFVPCLDKRVYRLGEAAALQVTAFDEHFLPLTPDLIADHLIATWHPPAANPTASREIALSHTAPGMFAAALPLSATGSQRIEVTDPITDRVHQLRFEVTDTSFERTHVARNATLQQRIATATGGQSFELAEAEKLLDALHFDPVTVHENRQIALWNTPLWCLIIVGLMLSEWTIRRLVYLR